MMWVDLNGGFQGRHGVDMDALETQWGRHNRRLAAAVGSRGEFIRACLEVGDE